MGPPQEVFDAVVSGGVETVRAWLTTAPRDLNVRFWYNASHDLDDECDGGNNATCATLLHAAVDPVITNHGPDQRAMVSLLLANGAEINATDVFGTTALHLSAGDLRMVAMLLERGADLNARKSSGATPLVSATRLDGSPDRFEIVRYLVSNGADLSVFEKDGIPRSIWRDNDNGHIADWLQKIQAAGSWGRYVREPRLALVTLRELCARGRAYPPAVKLRTISAETLIFERLFGAPASSAVKRSRPAPDAFPKEVFWHILSFWHTPRDDESTSEEVIVDELRGRAPPGSFYAVTLSRSETSYIDIQSIRYADPFPGGAFDLNVLNHAPAFALRVSKNRSESIPLNAGDIICGIRSLEVFGRSLSGVGQQVRAAMSTERFRLRLYRPRAGMDGPAVAAPRECAFACRAVTPFFNIARGEGAAT